MAGRSEIDLDRYIQAATRENTRVSYRAAVKHYEEQWQGLLPATPDAIAQYLASYAQELSVSTLKNRLSGLARWHLDQGFPDPTKTPLVSKVMKGIRREHPQQTKQAAALPIELLQRLDDWFKHQLDQNSHKQLLWLRNRAIILLGFWRALRADELSQLRVENIKTVGGDLLLYLPSSKSDRQNLGQEYQVPRLKALCPTQAVIDWLNASELKTGPLFRKIERNGQLKDSPLHPNSFTYIIRHTFTAAGINEADGLSGHSLRRGFATWAANSGWDVKTLMNYVGWQDAQTAMKYVQPKNPFENMGIADLSKNITNS